MVFSGIISVVIQDCNANGRIQMNASRGEIQTWMHCDTENKAIKI